MSSHQPGEDPRPFLPGLCSVTFRNLSPDDVIKAAVAAGLQAIEWGGDVHLPPGDVARAAAVARRCADAGVGCPSYGSYVSAGGGGHDMPAALDTAEALGARTVRVWAPLGVTPDAVRELAVAAGARGLTASLEFHPGTSTETAASTLALLAAVDRNDLYTYWQPVAGAPPARSISEYRSIEHRCSHVHVFWWAHDGTRRPLVEGAELWPAVLGSPSAAPRGLGPRVAYLEFVAGDDVSVMRHDALTLRGWCGQSPARPD
jgi:sugar phosphate isomerase/epimerase